MAETVSLKVRVQKLGTALSNMVMPNIPILIAWGLVTALFIEKGPFPNKEFATIVGPMLSYLIPTMIGYTGGKNVYEHRGGVVGAIATFGAIIATAGAAVGGMNTTSNVPMILGAMILGPFGAWLIKKFDQYVQPHIKAGFEMLVNNFSAGIMGFLLALFALKIVGPVVAWLTNLMGSGVDFLVSHHLIPLANIFIEPAKILFLNNAINQGILTPLGLQQAQETGHSLLYLLEANPGPGLGILLAFCFFGKGAAKATAPGAVAIHFLGGIHEIYFPYVMMKPALFLAVIGGGIAGTFTNNLLGSGLAAPASPGSIIAITLQAAPVGIKNLLSVFAGILVAAIVSFLIAAVILKNDKSVGDGDLEAAQAGMASEKATAKGQIAPTSTNTASNQQASDLSAVKHIIFACDAGMGSSAMGASILRNKAKKAGLSQDVTNVAIANLNAGADTIVVTQKELAPRAAQKAPDAVRYQVDNFMSSPVYDEVISSLLGGDNTPSQPVAENVVVSNEPIEEDIDLNQIDEVVFAHDAAHMGSAVMGVETLKAIFKNHDVKIPVSETEFIGVGSYNHHAIVVVTTPEFTAKAQNAAANAQHLSVESLITTAEYDKMVARMNK